MGVHSASTGSALNLGLDFKGGTNIGKVEVGEWGDAEIIIPVKDILSGEEDKNYTKAKQAVRDVARVLGATYALADQIAKAIPFELDMTLDKALNMPGSELKPLYESDDIVKWLMENPQS